MGCGSGLPTALGVGFTPLKGEPEVTIKSILEINFGIMAFARDSIDQVRTAW